jgi:hypothetical protein
MTNYVGIDYSGPGSTVNRDVETGIRYGMISQNSVMPEALDDVFSNGEDLGFETMKQQAKDELAKAIASAVDPYGQIGDPDELAAEIIDNAVEWHDIDESGPYLYEEGVLKVQTTSNNEMWVFKSSFYTRAQFCSPCVPGAGNLDKFCEDGPKTYCLGPDWFEGGKAPYNIWSVETDELVWAMPGYIGGEVDDDGLPV